MTGNLWRGLPVLRITIDTHPDDRARREREFAQDMGVRPHPPANGFAFIDTGAQVSCVTRQVTNLLQLPAMAPLSISTVSPGYAQLYAQSTRSVYARILIPELGATPIQAAEVNDLGHIDREPVLALLGANFLAHYRFCLYGRSRRFTLEIDS